MPPLISSLFCDVTQRRLVVVYWRFGITFRSYLQGSDSPFSARPLNIGPVVCTETSVTTKLHCVMSQKNEDRFYNAAEAWNPAQYSIVTIRACILLVLMLEFPLEHVHWYFGSASSIQKNFWLRKGLKCLKCHSLFLSFFTFSVLVKAKKVKCTLVQVLFSYLFYLLSSR
jgi:hypothetical protein